ncbi:hypothetical protein BGZ83_011776 [Gryganskiella cystojenkinii]|nr:hypothetical protein BGZ83_011776 [Gryganskiella cystojenkinii]
MMSNTTLPIPTEASSDVLSQAVAQKDSSYKFLYFNLHGRGELIRNLLAYGGHKWEELPVDWANQKSKTQFQCIPVVWETTSSGTILELAESLAIERYLAKKFNLLGKNAWEEHKVNEYYNSTDGAQQSYAIKVLNGPHENRVEEANKYYTEVLGKFITLHEQHLAKNGANGHYVGHQTSLADLKTAMLIDRLLLLRPKGAHEVPFSKEKTPNLWKVRETVNSHPSMAEWRHSQRFKELDAGTKQIFKMADEN